MRYKRKKPGITELIQPFVSLLLEMQAYSLRGLRRGAWLVLVGLAGLELIAHLHLSVGDYTIMLW